MNANTMLEVDTESFSKQEIIDIYEQHSPGIYRYAYRLLGDQKVAEDCVSETFSRLLDVVRRGGGPTDNVRAYLYRVAHNWITDYYRRKPLPELPLDIKEHVEPGSDPENLVTDAMERDRVRTAILRLPPEQQQIIQLRFLENWSHDEVARLLEKTTDATRSMQYRALASLRRMLVDDQEKDN